MPPDTDWVHLREDVYFLLKPDFSTHGLVHSQFLVSFPLSLIRVLFRLVGKYLGVAGTPTARSLSISSNILIRFFFTALPWDPPSQVGSSS